MRIKRLQVEGGFLHGLDLIFDPDLNVLIGGRGVGKTGVIELIRFCLSAPNLDQELSLASYDHAAGVLGDGQAMLTVIVDGEEQLISRSVTDRRSPPSTGFYGLPLIFSQREIETLGRTSRGRLNLIDSFFRLSPGPAQRARAGIKSLSTEIRELCGELDEISEQLEGRKAVEIDLANLKATQVTLGNQSLARVSRLEELDALQKAVNELSVSEHSLMQARERIERWFSSLPSNPQARAELGTWPTGNDPLKDVRSALAHDAAIVSDLIERARGYAEHVDGAIYQVTQRKAPIEDHLRQIRQSLEEEQAGSGRIAREIGRLEEALSRYKSIEQAAVEKRAKADLAHAERMRLLDEIDKQRQQVFEKRRDVAASLNMSLQPRVKVDVRHSVDVSGYEAAILEVLRGSYLRYAELAPVIARTLSPAELCGIVYEKNAKELGENLRISEDRAMRLVSALREAPVEDVLLAPIRDEVEFYLLDGSTYKHIDELSIGQRCTVLLSVVLENVNTGLIIDQPEDHLDNEFVADTLIKAIRSRELQAQTIVSTHNANIPVLGDASTVVHLDSNGQRGFVKCAGSLKSQPVADAILAIMEGGTEAFKKRAEFYGESA